jgi:hypothetical protein
VPSRWDRSHLSGFYLAHFGIYSASLLSVPRGLVDLYGALVTGGRRLRGALGAIPMTISFKSAEVRFFSSAAAVKFVGFNQKRAMDPG